MIAVGGENLIDFVQEDEGRAPPAYIPRQQQQVQISRKAIGSGALVNPHARNKCRSGPFSMGIWKGK